jgi:SAM-dependent methyltransferase
VARRRSEVLAELGGVQVRSDPDNPDGRLMLIDGIDASYVDLADPTFLDFGYVRRIGDVIDVAWPEGMPIATVHLGGAGATLARYIRATRPRSRQAVFEISADVLTLSREHLGLRSGAGLRVHQQDGRLGLLGLADASQDLVIGDAFDGTRVPESLGSAEAALEIARVLRLGGLYVLNVIDSPSLTYARAQTSTLRLAFGELAAIADPGVLRGRRTGNVVFVAGRQELPLAALGERARQAAVPERVMDTAACVRFAAGARPLYDNSPVMSTTAIPEFG